MGVKRVDTGLVCTKVKKEDICSVCKSTNRFGIKKVDIGSICMRVKNIDIGTLNR